MEETLNNQNTAVEKRIGCLLKSKGLTVATAESCTGGGIAALLTSVAGSSEYVKGGIVAYTNEIKEKLLHVKSATLEQYTAVSEQTVREMVVGAMEQFDADCAIASTGIAGPGGGTDAIPVGTIWLAAAWGEHITVCKLTQNAGRAENTRNAVEKGLLLLEKVLNAQFFYSKCDN